MNVYTSLIIFTEVLETNYYVALDSKHGKLYQIDRATQTPHSIEIDDSNSPSAFAFDSAGRTVVWVDANHGVLKQKILGKNGEVAMMTGDKTMSKIPKIYN